MPVSTDRPAPYAPPAAVLDIVRRYRERGLVFPVTKEVLVRAGVSESLVPRTLQALQILDLFKDDGNPTDTLEGIRLAPAAEYKQRLADWLKGAYAEVFAFVDPTKDDAVRIRDAFRSYNPVGQQDRMVTLFAGLCAEAGLMPEKPSSSSAARPAPSAARTRTTTTTSRGGFGATGTAVRQAAAKKQTGLPPTLASLLESLPPSAGTGWTVEERDRFLSTFKVLLDFNYPIVKQEKEGGTGRDSRTPTPQSRRCAGLSSTPR